MNNEFQNLSAEKQKQVLEAVSDMEKPCSPAEVRERLDRTENGGAKNSIKNSLTVFRLDGVLHKSIRYNLFTEKIEIVKPLWWHVPTVGLTPLWVTGQYCEAHERKVNSDYEKFSRDKNTKRRYGHAWKRIRNKYAAEHPFCELCFERGLAVPVEEAHHKVPLSEGGTHDKSNLIALRKSCHSQIHAKRGDRWK